eukprot:m.124579 g.124579  ORF g.124579 m.124579 type:complete len:136 (+) comp11156_c0_seq8:450-857(+)
MAASRNHPEPYETFLLATDGSEQKITSEPDPKIINAATFTINKEDHTLGAMLVNQLLRDPRVLFAGYKVPHPLENNFVLKIQVKEGCTPAQALETAIQDCTSAIASIQESFQEEVHRVRREEGQGGPVTDYYSAV